MMEVKEIQDVDLSLNPVIAQMSKMEHEQILFCNDNATGLKAIIAVHNTVLGPALGGTRMWMYKNEKEALIDVLRLSRGMTYKNSISGLKEAVLILNNTSGVGIVHLDETDVIRNKLVKKIVNAYRDIQNNN